jgi:xylulokinase
MLEWFRKEFPGGDDPNADDEWQSLIAQASASPPGARRVTFLPHMSGAGCPVVDPQSLGAFVGLTNRATRGDLVRAIFEGLDFQFLDIVTAMESVLQTRFEDFIAVGGATRNRFWMQNKADVIGRPIVVPAIEEATPLGAAILAGIGLGLYRDEEDACRRVYRAGETFQPDMQRTARYADTFEIYRQLYPALAATSHQAGARARVESSGDD